MEEFRDRVGCKECDSMGTTVYESEDGRLKITRYWGGAEKGTMFQINIGSEYILLRAEEYFKTLIGLLGGAFMRVKGV